MQINHISGHTHSKLLEMIFLTFTWWRQFVSSTSYSLYTGSLYFFILKHEQLISWCSSARSFQNMFIIQYLICFHNEYPTEGINVHFWLASHLHAFICLFIFTIKERLKWLSVNLAIRLNFKAIFVYSYIRQQVPLLLS